MPRSRGRDTDLLIFLIGILVAWIPYEVIQLIEITIYDIMAYVFIVVLVNYLRKSKDFLLRTGWISY